MALEELVDLVRLLRAKIESHRDKLQKSETLTRYVLIDPFLRALGWDIEDPNLVIPEVSTQAGRPDYALLLNGQRIAFIGAKSLGKQEDLIQQVSYCVSEGVRYFIATDGAKWEVYDTQVQKPLQEKKIAEWDITTMEPSEVIRRAFSIMRHAGFGSPPPTVIAPPHRDRKGLPLSELRPKKGEPLRYKSIRFPDGKEYEIRVWRDILTRCAEWLLETKRLDKGNLPVQTTSRRGYRVLINDTPKHKDGKEFRSPKKVDGLYVETNYSSKDIVEHSKRLLKEYPVNLDEVDLF